MLKGHKASPGVAIGRALVINNSPVRVERLTVDSSNLQLSRLESAIACSKDQLQKIAEKSKINLGEDHALIFESHQMLLEDIEVLDQTKTLILEHKYSSEFAYQEVTDQFIAVFESMDDEYMRARSADVKDISQRVLKNMLGIPLCDLSTLEDEVILVAGDITPSETAVMDRSKVVGFLTDIGGRTSHSAIIARTLEIPAVVGLGNISSSVTTGDLLVFDGDFAEVYVNPDETVIKEFEEKKIDYRKNKDLLKKYHGLETVTLDSKKIELASNIRSTTDVSFVVENDSEGVGLFRTEFLFMNTDTAPSEQEQFSVYSEVLSSLSPKPVVIRTLDIGGDKQVDYLNLEKEENPFLGVRGVRLCLENSQLFKTQLRALLRAGVNGNLKIMVPMISCLEEVLQVKELFSECERELEGEGTEFSKDYEFGMMIEVPSAAIESDILAKHVDFMSIGTNDLIQYTVAVDRMNQKLMNLYTPYNPAILRLINLVIQNAHEAGIWVGMCGEAACQKELVPLWVGMGIDELSVTPSDTLSTRALIRELHYSQCQKQLERVLQLGCAKEVENFLK
ncbi:MAG: phosphoenolpyruvate--protein phosphotransferase [Bacteriovoracaceae bacterium]|jgi:phosphoenolpyruvate-protein phosphotransferase (PTS system enzyme I)|nr:phosphoenolpyruvate--protein phosphotransferase [Bacteriovoracaceae bacterium]